MAFMKIKPTDSLFFRSGKPFNAGSDSWTDSSFLPNPSVIWGAMFSVLYNENKITKIKKSNKTIVSQEERKKLKIKNIYLYQEKNGVLNILIPTPLDVYIDENGHSYISKIKKVDFISNYPLDYISMLEKENLELADNCFIKIDSLYKDYQKHFELSLYSFDKIFKQDYKIGIKIDKDTKTTKKNFLYRIDLTQFENECGFLVEYELETEKKFEPTGILKLGGEGKTAKFEIIEEITTRAFKGLDKQREKSLKKIKEDKYFKLYFKTSALLKDWRLDEIEGLKLLSANVGKYIPIGGFDMEAGTPKEMKRYIPAGSIYIYKIEDETIDFKNVIEKEIEFDESYKGFGSFEILSVEEKIDE